MAQSPRLASVLATVLLAAVIPLTSATCYDRSGNVRSQWLPCDPNASTSTCCSSSDFCMSNGLCLNAGGNQAYTQQGCTDNKWGLPCNFYCPQGNPSDGLYYIEYCWRGFNQPANSWCCGVDCCSSTGTGTRAGNITIPIANDVYRPGARHSAAVTKTVTVGAGSTVTVTPGAAGGTGSAQQQDAGAGSGSGSGSAAMTLALGLGLGLGIPLLVVSAAALWMFFKKGKQQQQGGAGAKDISGMEVAPQQPPQQYNWAAWEEQQQHQQQQQQQQHQYGGKADASELGIANEPVELSGRQSHLKH